MTCRHGLSACQPDVTGQFKQFVGGRTVMVLINSIELSKKMVMIC